MVRRRMTADLLKRFTYAVSVLDIPTIRLALAVYTKQYSRHHCAELDAADVPRAWMLAARGISIPRCSDIWVIWFSNNIQNWYMSTWFNGLATFILKAHNKVLLQILWAYKHGDNLLALLPPELIRNIYNHLPIIVYCD